MKRSTVVAGVVALALVVLAGALGVRPAGAAPHLLAFRHHVVGSVVAIDRDAKTVTVQRMTAGGQATVMTFAVEDAAVASLVTLKTGESVRVTYVESSGKRIARRIEPAGGKRGK